MHNIKPGYKTTELWYSVAVSAVALLVGYGVMSDAEGELWKGLLASLLPAVLPVIGYGFSRAMVKRQ